VIAYVAARTPEAAGLLIAIGSLGAVLLLAVLWRGSDDLLAWALAPPVIAYAVSLVISRGGLDATATLVGAGLLLCGELAAWSLDAQRPIPAERGIRRRRPLAVAALVVAGVLAGGAVVAFAAAPVGGGLGWTALGAAGAVGAIGAAVAIVRRAERS
jgi:hypothetical protein